jgi:mitochondrial ATPase complex subunit ATP10
VLNPDGYRKSQISRPYFREWSNIDLHKGKTFIAPPRLFRGDLSLYFPNLHGDTIAKRDNLARDTTTVLEGKASVVSVFGNVWAQNQVKTLVSKEANPELHSVIEKSGGMAQLVQVNSEDNALRNWLIWLFKRSVRKQVGKENWDRYFIVRKGISDEIRESIGLLNSKVGYTYLVDHECRIRWAASGPSLPEEREGLAKGVRRILDEMAKEGVGKSYVRKSLVQAVPKQES